VSEESDTRWIIVGLGNPGRKYAKTRHNIGFELLDEFARELKTSTGAALRFDEREEAERAEGQLGSHRLLLLKPLSFMNRSGDPVSTVVGFYKVPLDRVVVVHDDIDLPFGAVRIKTGGGDGGHRGIRSIIERTGGDGFLRLKLGVGRPAALSDGEVSDWVLRPFQQAEQEQLSKLLLAGSQAIRAIVERGAKAAQNAFNVRPKPSAEKDDGKQSEEK
jgi:PTH1 family peptidyl-tRNA hydrolase